MKLPDFFKGFKRKSDNSAEDGASDSESESVFPGNATDELSTLPVGGDPAHAAEPLTNAERVESKEQSTPAGSNAAPKSTSHQPEMQRREAPPANVVQREPDSVESLWFSLVDNPNNEKNLNQLIRYCQTRKGSAAVQAALGELAMEESSFLPQLILSARALERKELKEALRHYDELLSRGTPNDYSLMRMSADLGRHGHPEELIRLTLPCYVTEKHNAYIGLNLLQACRECGRISDGRVLWARLRALNRPGITTALESFSAMFAPKESLAVEPDPADSPGLSVDNRIIPDRKRAATSDNQTSPVDGNASEEEEGIPDLPYSTEKRPRMIDIPIWKLWLPALRDILPNPEPADRVGIFLYSDTSSTLTDEKRISVRAFAAGLPLLIGEKLLFAAPVIPVVFFPISFSKGPDFGVTEPNVEGLFTLCAKESLHYLIAGTIGFDGQNHTIKTWILDYAKKTARVLSRSSAATEFGDAVMAHIEETIGPFADKNYAFEAKRRGFSYSPPSTPMIEAHLDALARLNLRSLVDSGLCSTDVLCTQEEFLESLAQLCRAKPFSQNYLMMLLAGMVSDRENGGETYRTYRELLFDNTHKLQYTPCVTSARKTLDMVLSI